MMAAGGARCPGGGVDDAAAGAGDRGVSVLRERFGAPAGEEMERFSSSLAVDLQMVEEDIDGSLAHAAGLRAAGLLSAAEEETIARGLEQVRAELRSGAYQPSDAAEDVHMAVEARLVELVGEPGQKLHTARSRNDQVATDVRLWLKRRLLELDAALVGLLAALLDRVERDGRVLMPGYTHLQRGQPILLGHHLLAHAWALSRDRERLADAGRRLDRCPLGAAALAGTPHPIDRVATAARLGFAGVVENAMDAVAARDHEQEVAAACAICMAHLSRMAEELVLWSASEFAFVALGAAHVTGSSIMPQKRNPDAAELVRGKAARVFGDLQALLVLVKGLPLAYNRDLQEDRVALFDAVGTTLACVRISAAVWRDLTVRGDRFEAELAADFSLATEVADLLAERGVPFRAAHGVVGRLVRRLEEEGRSLADLTAEEWEEVHPALGPAAGGMGDRLDPRAAAERRTSRGGTAWSEIERQVALLRHGLAAH
jgi:argininosuccinate lyase